MVSEHGRIYSIVDYEKRIKCDFYPHLNPNLKQRNILGCYLMNFIII